MTHETPLREAVREHVAKHTLHDTQFDALMNMQRTHQNLSTSHPPPTHDPRPRLRTLAAVASVAALALVVWTLWPSSATSVEIASEVARNHAKLKPLEVQSDKLPEVRTFFEKLDFALVDSEPIASRGWALRGGRYCSIQGRDAAQLRMVDPQTDTLRSVYMAAYEPERFGPIPRVDQGHTPMVLHSRGMKVEMWVERDVLIVTTGEAYVSHTEE